MAFHSFEKLEVWQRSCALCVRVYGALERCRDRALRDQMSRAAVSIASNIAEGAERGSDADFRRFVNIARGSAAELRTQLYIANRTGILETSVGNELTQELKRISAMLHGLSGSLKGSR